ncbi:acyltransferase [Streptococcus suis]|nr:acyltransferase [Streptococcus suis]
MYKENDRQSQVQNRSAVPASLRDIARKNCKRIFLAMKSIWIYVVLRIRYGKYIKMSAVNSIKGKLRVELLPKSSLQVGAFLMCAGPCYIKCTERAQCKIGEKVFINHNCSITCVEEITIGDFCNIANNVVIVDHDHRLGKNGVEDGLEGTPVHIGNNVWIAANTVILRGSTIGDGAVIAAGAVVKGKIPAREVWGGVPARKIKELTTIKE